MVLFSRGSENTLKMAEYIQLLCSYTYVDSLVSHSLFLPSLNSPFLLLPLYLTQIHFPLFKPITSKSLEPSHPDLCPLHSVTTDIAAFVTGLVRWKHSQPFLGTCISAVPSSEEQASVAPERIGSSVPGEVPSLQVTLRPK